MAPAAGATAVTLCRRARREQRHGEATVTGNYASLRYRSVTVAPCHSSPEQGPGPNSAGPVCRVGHAAMVLTTYCRWQEPEHNQEPDFWPTPISPTLAQARTSEPRKTRALRARLAAHATTGNRLLAPVSLLLSSSDLALGSDHGHVLGLDHAHATGWGRAQAAASYCPRSRPI